MSLFRMREYYTMMTMNCCRAKRFCVQLPLTLLLLCSCDQERPNVGADNGESDAGSAVLLEEALSVAAVHCRNAPRPVLISSDARVVGDGTPQSCTEESLHDVVDLLNAAGGGELIFDCGGEHTIELTRAVYVESRFDSRVVIDGGGQISLSGAERTRIIDVNNHTHLVVQSIVLEDGYVADGELKRTNTPSNSGAAIRHPWFGSLLAVDVVFRNNRCASREDEIGGGAVYAGGLDSAVFSACVFENNEASNGGAVLNRGSTLMVLNSVFSGNGALSTGNGQYGNGGGLYIDGMNYEEPGDFVMCGTRFFENTAMTHGSGVFAYFYEGSAAYITDCEFNANRFGDPESGSGALYHEAVPLYLTNTAFLHHRTGAHAGGIFIGQRSVAWIQNCTFGGNSVTTNGGALFNGAAQAHLTNCTFTDNAADYGPAIFKGQDATVTLKNCLFSNNQTENAYSATSCHEPLTDLGGNIQWPAVKNNGNPDTSCADGILFSDPLLLPIADNGGFSMTAAVADLSPAIGLAHDCPKADARGVVRSEPCTAGAYEVSQLETED